MPIATQLQTYLQQHHINYEVINHPYSDRALNTAHTACVPARYMVKAVVLQDDSGYIMAVMPSMNKLILQDINSQLSRQLHLVPEPTLAQLFPDCEKGVVPAIGIAYGLKTCWDDALDAVSDLYFQGGSHRELIHIDREQFQTLLQGQPHAFISYDPKDEDSPHYPPL